VQGFASALVWKQVCQCHDTSMRDRMLGYIDRVCPAHAVSDAGVSYASGCR